MAVIISDAFHYYLVESIPVPSHLHEILLSRNDPDVTVMKMYFLEDRQIQVHQSRVQMCPDSFPPGFYWYGNRKHGPGCPSKKIQRSLTQIKAALGQPPMSGNNHQSKESTGNIIGDNNN